MHNPKSEPKVSEYHVVIPARFGSTRLPGKALAEIAGHPMVYWVWQRALASQAKSVIVATDDSRIEEAMLAYGADVVMTSPDHPSGTDRLAEVVSTMGWSDDTVLVNLQGDEPMMPNENIEQVASDLLAHPEASIATLSEPITTKEEFENPAAVKVVSNIRGEALYFSRAMIPFPRAASDRVIAQRHIGMYAYRCGFLKRFAQWPVAEIESLESLEQLRALHNGEIIRVQPAAKPVPAGVDTEADLQKVRVIMEAAIGNS